MKKIFLFLIFFSTNYFLYSQGRQADAYGETAIGVNSYSITIKAITDASIYDKQSIWFRGNSNTSTSTLKVYGAGSISYPEIEITNNGSSLNAGDIVANQWYQLKYSLALNKWQIQKSNLFTSISATSPLSISGGSTSTISITSPLPIVNGGLNSSLTATSGTLLRGSGTQWLPTTLTFPNTIIANAIPFATASNQIGVGNIYSNGSTLQVGSNVLTSTVIIGGTSTTNGRAEIRITNSNSGSQAFASLSAINDANSLLDMGVRSSTCSPGGIDVANRCYISSTNGSNEGLALFTEASKGIYFSTDLTHVQNMLLNGSGNLKIGTGSPAEKLDVEGNITYSGGLKLGGTLGTSGQVLTTNGTTNSWTTLSTGVSSVAASAPLSSSGGATPTISITSPLPIANGGLNSTSTATAGTILMGSGSAWIPTTMTYPNTISQYEVPYATNNNVLSSSGYLTCNGFGMQIGTTGSIGPYTSLNIVGNYDGTRSISNTNLSSGTSSSSDLVLFNNAGKALRIGMRGSNYSGLGADISNRAYLITSDASMNGMIIGNTTASEIVFANGSSFTERARFSATGNFGINTTIPIAPLDVNGLSNLPLINSNSLTITTSAVTNPISLNIATHGDNSTTSYVTGVNINADQGLNVTGLNINASAINGGVANAGTFNSIASNALGYNNGIGCFSSNGKYNTSGNFQAMGGTNAIAASLWASGASTKNAALDILFGAIYLSGSAGTSGQVLTSSGTGTPTWTTPAAVSGSVTVTDDNSTNSPYFPTWVTAAGTPVLKMSSARVVFNPSNGRIGFNTASVTPTYDLSFGGTAARTLGVEQNTTSNTAGSNLTTYAGGATSGATDKDGGNYIINSGTSTGTGSSAIYFQTATSGTTGTSTNAVSTKMIIAGSGRVGIGTTGPGALLDVNQSSGNLALKITNSSVGTTGWFCYPNTNGSETDLRWGQKKADASIPDWFTFQSGGNLGIGTTSPSSKLHIVDANDPTTNGAAITVSLTNTVAVNSNTGVNTVVSTTGSGSTNYGFQSVVSGASNSINYGGFFTSQNSATKNYGVYCQAQNATNNYPLVAIGGNVGIGTTTPTQLLQVAGATGTVSVTDAGVINQDGAKTHNHIKLSLADDGTYTLPKDGIIGQVSVITYENNGAASIDGAIDFRYVAYPTTGTGILTQIRSTDAVNAATSDTDTKLCAYMSGEDVIIKNRLGEAKNLLILFDYY